MNASRVNPSKLASRWRWFWKRILVLLPIPLLWWAIRQLPLEEVIVIFRGLNFPLVLLWLAINAGLLVVMNWRWWLILRVLGHPVSFFALTHYRLAAFAVSYFTPGPQFGGEPLQVLALRQRHQVTATTGTASVSLDRLLELIANFTFLVFGVILAITGAWLSDHLRSIGLTISLGFLAFPLAYLVLMLVGKKPLTELITRIPESLSSSRLIQAIQGVERQMSRFCVEETGTVLIASLISLIVWVGLLGEYWLLTRILGLHLNLVQTVTALVAARLALLTPLPGGLGVMEASQILAFQTLGLTSSYGGAIAILIRMRDLFFGGFGLLSVVSLFGESSRVLIGQQREVSSKENNGV